MPLLPGVSGVDGELFLACLQQPNVLFPARLSALMSMKVGPFRLSILCSFLSKVLMAKDAASAVIKKIRQISVISGVTREHLSRHESIRQQIVSTGSPPNQNQIDAKFVDNLIKLKDLRIRLSKAIDEADIYLDCLAESVEIIGSSFWETNLELPGSQTNAQADSASSSPGYESYSSTPMKLRSTKK